MQHRHLGTERRTPLQLQSRPGLRDDTPSKSRAGVRGRSLLLGFI